MNIENKENKTMIPEEISEENMDRVTGGGYFHEHIVDSPDDVRFVFQRGDIVCMNTLTDSDLSDHVGIYLGGGKMIHASSSAAKVIISTLTSGYYNRVFSWGRRVV